MRCRIRMVLEAATANHAGPTYSLPLFPDGEGRTAGNSLGPRERGNWPGLQQVITGPWSAVYSMTRGSVLEQPVRPANPGCFSITLSIFPLLINSKKFHA
jgi:hypothetical protein